MAPAPIGNRSALQEPLSPPPTNSNTTVSHARKPSPGRVSDGREALHQHKNSKTFKPMMSNREEPSASRGRDFRVGNVGNNGLIYLRPVKPASQAPAHSSLATSTAPPTTPDTNDFKWRSSAASATTTRHSILSTSSPRAPRSAIAGRPAHRHARSASKSELGDNARQAPPRGAFKVVINRASQSQGPSSPKTLESLSIPHYRLGAPHFTDNGSAILHSSINTSSSKREDRSPNATQQHLQGAPRVDQELHVPKAEKTMLGGPKLSPTALKRNLHKVQSREQHNAPQNPTNSVNQTQVFNLNGHRKSPAPEPDIRVSTATGQLLAASIPQLIAQITSPKLLDYELLSDFFLTYRLFMTPSDLATRLVERLQIAIGSSDEFSRVVRVRTFVALRHWILNYFVDDFVSDFDLRARFCVLVNRLCRSLEQGSPEHVGDLRILEELKKCWRHTCALFWDVPLTPNPNAPHEDIVPGGHLGSRATPVDWDNGGLQGSESHVNSEAEEFPSQLSPTDSLGGEEFAFNQTHKLGSSTASSISSLSNAGDGERQSVQAMSCSIPTNLLTGSKHQRDHSLGPRPLPTSTKSPKQATKPPSSADNGKKHHSRPGSFSDALRDERTALGSPKIEPEEPPPEPMIIPGSLIRGAIVSPGTPYVESTVSDSPTQEIEPPELATPPPSSGSHEHRGRQNQQPNPGMRRLFGTVRRALSAKNTAVRPHSPNPVHGRDGPASSNSVFGTPTNREPSAQKRKLVDGRAALRIDVLTAEVAESFKVAVQQVQEAQHALQHQHSEAQPSPPSDSASPERHLPLLQVPQANDKGLSVTTGSRSIVILDDTNGQITPRTNLDPHVEQSQQMMNHVPSMQSHGYGVQSVPLFLDQGSTEPTETLDDDSQFYTESSTGQTHNWPPVDQLHAGLGDRESKDADPSETPKGGNARLLGQKSNSRLQRSSLEATTTATETTRTSTDDPSNLERLPARQLRRLPAGNLRAAHHVHSLDEQHHPETSFDTRSVLHAPPNIPPRTSSTNRGQVEMDERFEETDEGSEALSKTSQPVMRPSFEREVAKLAQLPDSTASDNGIESALAKLEGRGKGSPSEPAAESSASMSNGPSVDQSARNGNKAARRQHRENEVLEVGDSPVDVDTMGNPHSQVIVQHRVVSMTESSFSHSSIPLLERGVSHPPRRYANTTAGVKPLSPESGSRDTTKPLEDSVQTSETMPGSEESYEFVEESESLQQAKAGKKPVQNPGAHQSFLLNDNETLSELSSLTPDDVSQHGHGGESGLKSFWRADGALGVQTSHQSEANAPHRRSPSASVIPRPSNPTPESPTDEYQVDPAYVPGTRSITRENSVLSAHRNTRSGETARSTPLITGPSAAHLPFILAHDSWTLAQQLTVIERDALCEVDWRDLIDLRWNQTATAYYSWVDYLRSSSGTDAMGNPTMKPGVDMCIARFNLVVRWVKSQVVLTQDLMERVACIVKFIHIARHARRLRNWATMYQISMALVSADMSRLKQTWAAVPVEEKDALAALEDLIMPRRNFNNLRMEIESATSAWAQGGAGGCIPFIGIYTHDLIYNAQKPPRLRTNARGALVDAANLDGEPLNDHRLLVNFERHHTAATIVKNLLRLIEASSKYTFQPDSEITSRCLWIGALHDAEVTRRSKELEPFERTSA